MNSQPRSAVLIVKNQKILLIKRDRAGQATYYVLPGGGIEEGETPEMAAIREMHEELGVEIQVINKEKDSESQERETWIIKASLVDGVNPVWQEEAKQSLDNHYEVVWVGFSDVSKLEVYPNGIIKILRREK